MKAKKNHKIDQWIFYILCIYSHFLFAFHQNKRLFWAQCSEWRRVTDRMKLINNNGLFSSNIIVWHAVLFFHFNLKFSLLIVGGCPTIHYQLFIGFFRLLIISVNHKVEGTLLSINFLSILTICRFLGSW